MTTALIVLATLALLTILIGGSAILLTRRRDDVTLVALNDGAYLIRGWGWRARAELVIHEDMGRVYQVRWHDRVTYCPPTAVMLRGHVQRERDARVGLSTNR